MPALPHLPWPYQLGKTVEQDTFDELAASAAVALCTPRGQREDVADFGTTIPLFDQVPVDVERLKAELDASDPRLTADIDDVTTLVDATIARLQLDLTVE